MRQPGTPALPVTDSGIILINVTNGVSWMLPPSPQEGAAPDWVTWWPDGRLLVCHWTARDIKVGNMDDIILQTRLWLVDPDTGVWEEIGRIGGWGRAYGGPGGAYLWTERSGDLQTYESLYLAYASDHGPRVRVQLNNSRDYGWSPQGDFVAARFWADPWYEDLILVSTADGQRHPIKLVAIAADGERSTAPLAPEEMVVAKAQFYHSMHYTRKLFAINMLTGHQRLISRLLPKLPHLSRIGSCLAGRWVLLWQADPEGERPHLVAMNVQDSRFYPVTQAGVFARLHWEWNPLNPAGDTLALCTSGGSDGEPAAPAQAKESGVWLLELDEKKLGSQSPIEETPEPESAPGSKAKPGFSMPYDDITNGLVLINGKNFSTAEQHFAQLSQRHPDQPLFPAYRSLALFQLDRGEEARQELARALALRAEDADSILEQAAPWAQARDVGSAEKFLGHMLATPDTEAHRHLLKALLVLGSQPAQAVEELRLGISAGDPDALGMGQILAIIASYLECADQFLQASAANDPRAMQEASTQFLAYVLAVPDLELISLGHRRTFGANALSPRLTIESPHREVRPGPKPIPLKAENAPAVSLSIQAVAGVAAMELAEAIGETEKRAEAAWRELGKKAQQAERRGDKTAKVRYRHAERQAWIIAYTLSAIAHSSVERARWALYRRIYSRGIGLKEEAGHEALSLLGAAYAVLWDEMEKATSRVAEARLPEWRGEPGIEAVLAKAMVELAGEQWASDFVEHDVELAHILEVHPDELLILYLRGLFWLHRDAARAARTVLPSVPEADPEFAHWYLLMAKFAWRREDRDESLELLDKFLAVARASPLTESVRKMRDEVAAGVAHLRGES